MNAIEIHLCSARSNIQYDLHQDMIFLVGYSHPRMKLSHHLFEIGFAAILAGLGSWSKESLCNLIQKNMLSPPHQPLWTGSTMLHISNTLNTMQLQWLWNKWTYNSQQESPLFMYLLDVHKHKLNMHCWKCHHAPASLQNTSAARERPGKFSGPTLSTTVNWIWRSRF